MNTPYGILKPELRCAVMGDIQSITTEANTLLEDHLQLLQTLQPDVLLLLGDNAMAGETHAENLALIRKYHRGDILSVPGNHDYDDFDNSLAAYNAAYPAPSALTYGAWKKEFGSLLTLIGVDSSGATVYTNVSVQHAHVVAWLGVSTTKWNILMTHKPAYTNGDGHLADEDLAAWTLTGTTLYLNGHNHVYERIEKTGMLFVTNGCGPGHAYGFDGTADSYCQSTMSGILLLDITHGKLTGRFVRQHDGMLVDEFERYNTYALTPTLPS